MSPLYPFPAIIGQEDLKLALLLNAINPKIGGVLIRGEKGTAKSTIVRSLADLLPEITQRKKVVTLPLNATEDRVSGGMDFEQAVRTGKKELLPGLLAEAHQAILYVDEINLLDDHIVDIVLDAAASGWNRIERESLSLCHPSEFLLVGTMNPEEGDLRPQLLDRFGFCVEVTAEVDLLKRVELMVQRERFDADPNTFRQAYSEEIEAFSEKIREAADRIRSVHMPEFLRSFIAELCNKQHVAGHRADIVIEQGAIAHAAFLGKTTVAVDDIQAVSKFALLHRKQEVSDPPTPPPPEQDDPSENSESSEPEDDQTPDQNENQEQETPPPPEQQPDDHDATEDASENQDHDETQSKDEGHLPQDNDQLFEIGETFRVRRIESRKDKKSRRGSGRRSRTRVSLKQGRYVKSTLRKGTNDIAFDATLRAAAPFQKQRKIPKDLCVALNQEDIREKIREKKTGNFLLFVVDASGSMGAKGRMSASKGAIMSLLLDAYQKRDKVAMISFRKESAVVNLPATSSIELAAKRLSEMPVGGRTPLSAGLEKAIQMIQSVQYRDSASRPIVIIITDGRSNVAVTDLKPIEEALMMAGRLAENENLTRIVVDTESKGPVMFGLAGQLAAAADAAYYKIDDLKSETLVDLVRGHQ